MIYKLDKLQELSRGDEDFILSIVSVFLEETPQDLSDLKGAISNENYEEIYQYAHKIKPNVDLLGMEETRVKVLEIETQGRGDKNLTVINELLPSVELAINTAIKELKENFGL